MDDKLEKKLKDYLPYLIVLAVIFLLLPCLVVFTGKNGESSFLNDVIFIGVFPLSALVSCVIYSYKNKNEFAMSLIAPILFIPTMFIYGIFKSNPLVSIIYLVAYFLCGFLGLMIGDYLKNGKGTDERKKEDDNLRPRRHTASHVSRRAREEQQQMIEVEEPINEEDYSFGDESTTDDDIDEILREIRSRNKDL